MPHSSWVVACADGLESLLAEELQRLGATVVRRAHGALTIEASQKTAYEICLWSRLASRVYKPLLRVEGNSPDALYEQAVDFPWREIFTLHKTFAVRAVAARGVQTHTQYMALKLKDAVVDHFRQVTGQRPNVRGSEPDIALHLFIDNEAIEVSLDMSGESLHRRGYRGHIGEAPLKETLAAAILMQAGWPDARFEALVDPMCGSGTFLIEAALMHADIAPGLMRNHYGFLAWAGHQADVWRQCLREADEREAAGIARPWPKLIGSDANIDALNAALKNARAAGVSDFISLERRELWQLPRLPAKCGLLVTNPPYGERLGDGETVQWLYRCLGRLARERLPGWQAAVLAADIQHGDALGLPHLHTQRLRNGDLNVFVRHAEIPVTPPQPLVCTFKAVEGDIPAEGQYFANRLQKNIVACRKSALQEETACYRVYDADLPEFNLAIDVYGDCLHVQEYAPPKVIDPEKAAARFKLALGIIRQVFGLHREKVFIKVRSRQKGTQQYEKLNQRGRLQEVREGPARLLVNLTDYLDTGLFLDHRPMRLRIGKEAAGKRFLNLYAYTGSVSVHAALGGARETVSVDLSPTYLQWARRNFAVNGLSEQNHQFIEDDVLSWLRDCRDTFDLIFIDPPTFSNSKKTSEAFDVQRDHVEVIFLAMRRLSKGGVCYFSNNFRRFVLDEAALRMFNVREISADTIGFDYRRNAKIHRCWEVWHPG